MSDTASYITIRSDISYPSSVNDEDVDYPSEDGFFSLNNYENPDGEKSDEETESIVTTPYISMEPPIYKIYIWLKKNMNDTQENDEYFINTAKMMDRYLRSRTPSENQPLTIRYFIDRYSRDVINS